MLLACGTSELPSTLLEVGGPLLILDAKRHFCIPETKTPPLKFMDLTGYRFQKSNHPVCGGLRLERSPASYLVCPKVRIKSAPVIVFPVDPPPTKVFSICDNASTQEYARVLSGTEYGHANSDPCNIIYTLKS
jgi:hypothetical protein